MKGSLSLLLHAHLPFVRDPHSESCPEERWLFEAITESYVPLLRMMQRLREDGVPFKLTLSVSPTLASMLADPLLLRRYVTHLELLGALAEKETERNRTQPCLATLSHFYRAFFDQTRRVFVEQWNCDLLGVIRELRDAGALDLIATGATHAILPILQQMPGAAEGQVVVGCDFFREVFGAEPSGFWLPECAYAPGLESLLQDHNIRWFALDVHGLDNATPPARCGSFLPCFTPGGPAAFARDSEIARQVWSAQQGYPGDPVYRDFHRDIGFDLSARELEPLEHAHGKFTGIKYHRVSGENETKQPYVPAAAEEKARQHALHFIELCTERLKQADGDNAILIAPFDAELFGHWWFEGPLFLEHVIRRAAEKGLALTTPGEFLRQHPTLQVVQPASSSWGDGGFLDVWLDEKCGWIYPQLNAAQHPMIAWATSHAPSASAQEDRVLRQLARELLLAQASDWPFLIRNGTAAEYATHRVQDHLARFNRLATALEQKKLDLDFLAQCEERDNLFPNLDWRHYCHSERSRGIPACDL